MLIAAGTYTGDGTDDRALTPEELTFTPSVLLVNGANREAMGRTSTMGVNSEQLTGIAGLATGCVKSLDTNGFTLGTDVRVNEDGAQYRWLAFGLEDEETSLAVGTYEGTGALNPVTGVGFQPDAVWVFTPASGAGNFAFVATAAVLASGDSGAGWAGAWQGGGDLVDSLNADGFTLEAGGSTSANRSGQTYHYAAFADQAGVFAVGNYTGDGTDDRSITGAGFAPNVAIVKIDNANAASIRFPDHEGDQSDRVDTLTDTADMIQAFESDGIQVGTNQGVNNLNDAALVMFMATTASAASGGSKRRSLGQGRYFRSTVGSGRRSWGFR